MTNLPERVEAATGPDRALDAEIAQAVSLDIGRSKGDPNDSRLPAYTASIDAAMTLVPEGSDWALSVAHADTLASIPVGGTVEDAVHGYAATPALALCAAALRARKDQS